jgi:hypothetical protein
MKNTRKDADFDDFYASCLAELKARPNWTEAFIPLLERYATLTSKLNDLNSKIIDEEIIVNHTNKNDHTNQASSPSWRMFLALNSEANKLAKQLGLSPDSAPVKQAKEKKGFNLGGEMKVA